MFHRKIVLLPALLMAAALFFPSASFADAPEKTLQIYYTCNTLGYIHPCPS